MTGGRSSGVGQVIGVGGWSPLGRDESCLASEVASGLLRDAVVDLVVDDDDDRDHEDSHYRERLQKQSVREFHARSLTFLMR
jgi:hypothetical protein